MKYLSLAFILLLMSFSLPKEKHFSSFENNDKVFAILNKKCNVCHRTKNPSKVFSLDNMDGFAKKINRQVFIWKRMPKGNEIHLTKEEKQILSSWINTQNHK